MDQTFQAQSNNMLMTPIFLCISAVLPLFQGLYGNAQLRLATRRLPQLTETLITSKVFTAVICKPCHQVWLPALPRATPMLQLSLRKGFAWEGWKVFYNTITFCNSPQEYEFLQGKNEKGIKLSAFQGVFVDCNKTRWKRWDFPPHQTSPANHFTN